MEEKTMKEIEENENVDILTCQLMAQTQTIELMYDMNKRIHHMMNLFIIIFQTILCAISVIVTYNFKSMTITIPLACMIGTLILFALVIIGNLLSKYALKKATRQKDFIFNCISKIIKKKGLNDDEDK